MRYLGDKDSKEQCLAECRKHTDATACEFVPPGLQLTIYHHRSLQPIQAGCIAHTKDVSAGSGDYPYQCFVFSGEKLTLALLLLGG